MTQKSEELSKLYEEMKANLLIKNQAAFAEIIGFGRNHVFKTIKSEDGVPQSWIDRVKEYIAKKKGAENAFTSNAKNAPDVNVAMVLRDFRESQIRTKAKLSVLEEIVDKMVSDQTKRSIALVSAERRRAADIEADRLFVLEARKQHK